MAHLSGRYLKFSMERNFIGSACVTSNGNGFTDQFIGLHSAWHSTVSTCPILPSFQNNVIYIDDLYIGSCITPVPEPGTLALLRSGMAGGGVTRKKKRIL